MKRILVVVVIGLLVSQIALAGDFQWLVNCKEVDESGRTHFWIGYSSSEDLPDSYIEYIGNTGGVFNNDVRAGVYERQLEVLLEQPDSTTWISLDPQGYDITITHDMPAPDCDAPVQVDMASITIYVDSGTSFSWQIWDGYTWNDIDAVTPVEYDADGHAFTRLTLGPDNPDHNPNDYRVEVVS